MRRLTPSIVLGLAMAAWIPVGVAAQPAEPEPSYFLIKDFRLHSSVTIYDAR